MNTTIRYTGDGAMEVCIGRFRRRFEPDETVEIDVRFGRELLKRPLFEAVDPSTTPSDEASATPPIQGGEPEKSPRRRRAAAEAVIEENPPAEGGEITEETETGGNE